MADITTIIPQIFGGLAQFQNGQNLTILGSEMAAASYRQAGVASIAAANYNNAISRLNFNRQMDSMSREIRNFVGTQQVAAASTGFKSSSKSFLELTNDTLNIFERTILDARNSQKQAESATLFEAQAQQVQFENQARAAEYQAEIASARGTGSLISSVASSITKLF